MNEDKLNHKSYMVRYGEVALKGSNKPYFERLLMNRIRKKMKGLKDVRISREEGLLIVRTPEEVSEYEVIREIGKVFGVDSISPAKEVPTDLEVIGNTALEMLRTKICGNGVSSFKVEVKRSDKSFPITSPEIASIIGAKILKESEGIRVDVHNPDCRVYIHVRRGRSFVFLKKIPAFGGLPLGSNGRGLVLLSGGIDSPVAGFMMARRGMQIEAVHFHSYPYTSERAFQKVLDLSKTLSVYCGDIRIHSVNILPIQEEIVKKCPEDEITVLIRRFMMKISERIAQEKECNMLITGENLGQVASQTAFAIVAIDEAVAMPVMRPLIAMDKSEIIEKAKEIGTYEISILPYEDCCTVFLPKHPDTKPRLERILASERLLDSAFLIDAAMADIKTITV